MWVTYTQVGGLRPHTLYTFTVVVWAGSGAALRAASRAHSSTVATREAPPPAPHSFRATHQEPSALAFSWALEPADANGVLRRFLLEYAPQSDPERVTTLEFPPDGNVPAHPTPAHPHTRHPHTRHPHTRTPAHRNRARKESIVFRKNHWVS